MGKSTKDEIILRRGATEVKDAAIAEANTLAAPRKPRDELDLQYAEQDYRVAMSDARDAYEAAVERAEATLDAAERHAETVLEAARARARSAAYRRDRFAEMLTGLGVDQLRQMLRHADAKLAPGYAVNLPPAQRPEVQRRRDMIAAELHRQEVT